MLRLSFLFILLLSHGGLFSVAQDKIFREYDIRGVVGEEFEIEDAYEMTRAINHVLLDKESNVKKIVLGKDGRIHSQKIANEVTRALTDQGFDVIDVGVCTTPIMYYALHVLEVDAGLMVTASHNPGEYNGIKIRLGTNPVYGADIQQIREYYKNKNFIEKAEHVGEVHHYALIPEYINYLSLSFSHLIGANFHAILDCGNGAVGTILPQLVEKMKWKHVNLLYAEVDGTYPNHIADPSVEAYMADLKKQVIHSDATIGLGFDGDGDRMAPVTKKGLLVKGDQLLTFYGLRVLKDYPGSAIVFDVSSSNALFKIIKNAGGVPVIAATGIAKIKNAMVNTGAKIGGEMSCHTIFSDRYFGYDDGIYSMMRLFDMLYKSEESLDDMMESLPTVATSPLFRIPCERSKILAMIEDLKVYFGAQEGCELITVDGLRVHLPNGWAIVRPSNTEPVVSIRFEGDSKEDLMQITTLFHHLLNEKVNCEEFKPYM